MSIYTKQHYESVAAVVQRIRGYHESLHPGRRSEAQAVMCSVEREFANLFAADNPPICSTCGTSPSGGQTLLCSNAFGAVTGDTHTFEGGFDREKFLAACGLEESKLRGETDATRHSQVDSLDSTQS